MKRIWIIGCALVAGVAATFAFAAQEWWGPASSEGKSLHTVRLLENAARRPLPKFPLVAWIGDSTIMGREIPPYPRVIQNRLKAGKKLIQTANVSHAGIGPFVEYCLVGKVLPLEPDALFIVANFQSMARSGGERGVLEIARFIPSGELMRAAFLPWHHADITIPRLLLARSLAWPQVEKLFLFGDGLRQLFRDQIYGAPRKMTGAEKLRINRRRLESFALPFDANSPQVVMLRAAVDLAVRNRIPTTVVLTPLHPRVFQVNDPTGKVFAERSSILRDVIESAGARFVDLHDALPARQFRDTAGHFNEDGIAHMATLLARFVRHDTFGSPQQ